MASLLCGLGCIWEEEIEADMTCEACLQSGGTWQVEANACTTNCDIQDISCFRDACPAPCAADSCGSCFNRSECEAVDCTWRGDGAPQWCSSAL